MDILFETEIDILDEYLNFTIEQSSKIMVKKMNYF